MYWTVTFPPGVVVLPRPHIDDEPSKASLLRLVPFDYVVVQSNTITTSTKLAVRWTVDGVEQNVYNGE